MRMEGSAFITCIINKSIMHANTLRFGSIHAREGKSNGNAENAGSRLDSELGILLSCLAHTCSPEVPSSLSMNFPRPRPPARIWLLMTTSSSPIFSAASTACWTVWAGMPKGTLTPHSPMILALWYSCRFRLRTAPTAGAAVRFRTEGAAVRLRRAVAAEESMLLFVAWLW